MAKAFSNLENGGLKPDFIATKTLTCITSHKIPNIVNNL